MHKLISFPTGPVVHDHPLVRSVPEPPHPEEVVDGCVVVLQVDPIADGLGLGILDVGSQSGALGGAHLIRVQD